MSAARTSKDGVNGVAFRRGTAGHSAPFRSIGRSFSLSPKGIARSVAPAFPPRPGHLLCRMTNPSRAEPFAGREDVSLPAHAADLAARRHKEAGPAMEPAKSGETNTMTAKQPSRALPETQTAKLCIITGSTRSGEYGQW